MLYLLISETGKPKSLDFTPNHVNFEIIISKIRGEDHNLLLQIMEFLSKISKTETRQRTYSAIRGLEQVFHKREQITLDSWVMPSVLLPLLITLP